MTEQPNLRMTLACRGGEAIKVMKVHPVQRPVQPT